ncbi:hypothetical protein EVAR_84086_1 [Eumeta japonica]|uniref:Uncharacterized protein n=1 Tax=Eumeta variegata TaxID=151549 RepID=A0A4C1UZG2_EUMVA|nr:hypothetical protein EVAR_84086_1 [Eumeta japonica]
MRSPNASFPRCNKRSLPTNRQDVLNSANPNGHGGFAQYLFKFKLKDLPYCACDSAKFQDVLHVLEECDMFLRKLAALEAEVNVRIARRHFPEIMEKADKIRKFLLLCCGYK